MSPCLWALLILGLRLADADVGSSAKCSRAVALSELPVLANSTDRTRNTFPRPETGLFSTDPLSCGPTVVGKSGYPL